MGGQVEVVEEGIGTLGTYAGVPIAFEVARVFEVLGELNAPGGVVLSERRVEEPYGKDYDAIEGAHPARWEGRFDVRNWGVFAARIGGKRVGGATVAYDTAGFEMLEGRRDVALLWDIRVSPEVRGQGVGSALLRAVEAWAIARGCRRLKIETQNTNVAACRFYARHGCVLKSVDRFAYAQFPEEIQLIWEKDL